MYRQHLSKKATVYTRPFYRAEMAFSFFVSREEHEETRRKKTVLLRVPGGCVLYFSPVHSFVRRV